MDWKKISLGELLESKRSSRKPGTAHTSRNHLTRDLRSARRSDSLSDNNNPAEQETGRPNTKQFSVVTKV